MSALEGPGSRGRIAIVPQHSDLLYAPVFAIRAARRFMTEASTLSVPHRDFFISRCSADAAFAGWIGELIVAQGKTFVEQSKHFGHEDFMNAMHRAFLSGARVVALYSQSYLDSKYCVREATEALKGDPANEQQRLIPLRIEPCAPAGMLNITYTDLLAERRQADGSALATRICRALDLAAPDLSRLPPLPEGLLVVPPRLIHPQIRISRSDLAPRPELMAEIASAMSRAGGNSQPMVAAVAGMAGAGKTVLARNFAVQHQDAYHAVWWIDAERRDASRTNMLAAIAALGAELSERIKTEARSNIEEAARDTLTLIEAAGYARPFLLVYDNVNRPEDIECWTPRSGAHILVTTRYGEWVDMVAKVKVGVLNREAAIKFLLRRGRKRPEEGEAASRLADALDCLPLALDHAASYCALGRRPSFDEYLGNLDARLDYEPNSTSGAGDRGVRKTFAIALQRVIDGDAAAHVKPCPDIDIIMGVAALLAPVPIHFAIFSHPRLASVDVDGAFRALAEVSLITTSEDDCDNGTFTVHRLVQAIMRDRLADAGLTADYADLGIDLLDTRMPSTSPACSMSRATWQRRADFTSGRWRSPRRCPAPSIPTPRRAAGALPILSSTWATGRRPGRFISMYWRSARRCSAGSTNPGSLCASLAWNTTTVRRLPSPSSSIHLARGCP